MFPDADAITGRRVTAVRRRAVGRPTSPIPSSRSPGARAHNRFLVELCAHSPERRGRRRRWCRSPTTSTARSREIEWLAAQRACAAGSWCRRCGATTRRTTTRCTTRCGRRARRRHAGAHALGLGAAGGVPGEHRHLPRRGRVVGRAGRCGSCCSAARSSGIPSLKFCVTESAAYWAPDMMWKWDPYLGGGHTTKKLVGAARRARCRGCRASTSARNVFIGASTMSREEIRRRYAIGTDTVMWGNDYPHPEGTWPHTVAKLRRDVPRRPRRGLAC